MEKKLDLRIIKSKSALNNALLILLQEKPLEKVTISELCRTAKVNRGTFYLHYKSVDDLFTGVFKEIMYELRISYQDPYIQAPKFKLENLNPNTIQIFQHIEYHKTFYNIIFSKNIPIMYYYLLFEEINRLVKANAILDESVDEDIYAAYHANAILGVILHWHETGFELPVKYLNKQLMSILLNSRNSS